MKITPKPCVGISMPSTPRHCASQTKNIYYQTHTLQADLTLRPANAPSTTAASARNGLTHGRAMDSQD